jgi:glycosyltransferase involved in cell wall biosynthesis
MQRGASWDVAHMVTPVTTLAAGRLHRLGMPVIKGPLNNGIANPSGFASLLRDDHPWLTPLRNLGKIADGLAGSTRNSAVLLTATAATLQMIPPRYRQRCISMLENAVDLDVFVAARWPAEPSRSHPLHALFVGRLVPFKALSLLLHAITRLRQDFPLVLTVIGDGPMDAKWRREAVELGVQDIVDFRGACNLDEVAAAMRDAHVFCLPSIRESGGAVLLEAMASARPVIAVGFGGPAELIDERVGKAVRPDGIETVIAGFADALRDVWLNPDAWRRRGEEGRRRAEERFCWEAKIDRTVQIYETLAVAANPGA